MPFREAAAKMPPRLAREAGWNGRPAGGAVGGGEADEMDVEIELGAAEREAVYMLGGRGSGEGELFEGSLP